MPHNHEFSFSIIVKKSAVELFSTKSSSMIKKLQKNVFDVKSQTNKNNADHYNTNIT